MYIKDEIKEAYKKWNAGDTVFISSPTGSGKTTFILKALLPYLVQKRQKMLYLVNRRILKEQLEKEISNLPLEQREAIKIELYQNIENKISNLRLRDAGEFFLDNKYKYKRRDYFADGYSKMKEYDGYDCVVCDEAHYFLMDSNYNTNTILSFKFVRDCFDRKLRIYISATIDQIKEFVKEDNCTNQKVCTYWLRFCSEEIVVKNFVGHNEHEYSAERDYDYLDIGIINQRKEIVDLVSEGNEKWLIFVDNKESGRALKKEIEEYNKKKNELTGKEMVAFITSDYQLDVDSTNEVNTIVNSNKQTAKVLIATSVLDNGINIKDMELRNIIIIADTETEFIQMLGRKRKDGRNIKVYIYKHSKEHFRKRERINKKRQKLAEENYKEIHKDIQPYLDMKCDINTMNKIENDLIALQHKPLIQKMMNNEESYQNIKSLFLTFQGILYLNMLSFRNIENLNKFYRQMFLKFENDGEDAFLREQLRWLNKTEEEIDGIINNAKIDQNERSRRIVLEALKGIEGKLLEEKDFIEFKNKIRKDLEVLVNSVGKENPSYRKYNSSVKKNDRVISEGFMDFLREECGISYRVEKSNQFYIVKPSEN